MERPRETVIKQRIVTEKSQGRDKYAPHDRGRGSRGRRGRGRGVGGGGRGGGQDIPVPQGRGKKPEQRGRGRGGGNRGTRDFRNLGTDPALRVQREETETWAASMPEGVASTLGEDNGSFETEEERKQQLEVGGPDEVHPGQGRHLIQEAAQGAAGRVEQRGLQPGGKVPQHGAGEGL